mgnify:FL=1
MDNEQEKQVKKGKKNKFKKVINITSILMFISFLFLSYSILLISGVETELRYIGIGILLLINLIVIFLLRKIIKKKKTSRYIIYFIILLILTVGQATLGYFVFKTYSSINNINKDKITYSTSLVVRTDSKIEELKDLKDKKIGILNDKSDIDNHVLGMQLIKNEKLNDNNTIVDYDDLSSLISDLYKKKVDAIIVSSNYVTMFKSIETYSKIEEETKVIKSLEKTYKKSEISKITGEDDTTLNQNSSIKEPFTLLLMGVDATGDKLNKNATGNGDSLMLITFNPKTLNATILSIPRDSYVYIPNMGTENKITHAAWGGTNHMIRTIENFTDVKINYYMKINFRGVVKLVDALGGVYIDVPTDMCTDNSFRYGKICLKEGYQKLNGEQALSFARNRYAFATGDLQRGVNQQIVVQAMLNELKNIKSASQALNILDTVSESMDTNFTTKQLLSFYDIFKTVLETSSNDSNLINVQQLYLAGSGQNIYDERTGWVLYNYIINQSSLNKVKDAMKKNLSTSTKTMTKEMDFDIEDKFEMTTIGKTGLSATKLYTLLPNFEGKSIDYAKSWLNSNGITDIKIEYVESDKDDGTILSQSLPASKRVDLIKGSITFKVAEKKEEVVDPTPVEPTDPTDPTEPTNPGEDNTPTTGEDTKPETPSTGENTEGTNNNE